MPWFPKPDEKIDSELEQYFGGGVTANFIVSTTRLGIPSAFIGAVGDDSAGEFLIEDMKKEGVNTQYLLSKKGLQTPVNFIFVIKDSGEENYHPKPLHANYQVNSRGYNPRHV